MIDFKILKTSKKSRARLGVLKTPRGEIETPALVSVATQAVVKTLTSEEAEEAGARLLIANTFHLHTRLGEKTVKAAGGLHSFMQWPHPLMTDSGGFQVFSLGFGKDFGTGKILKEKSSLSIAKGEQPRFLKITDEGVHFALPLDGRKLFLGPKESIKIQEALGADIMFAFDECPSPLADYEYSRISLARTHRWAKDSLCARKSKQALFGIVQGGKFEDLRRESARFIAGLDFDGFGIGGEFGDEKKKMVSMLRWVVEELPGEKPRHLLGIGHPEDIPKIIREGVDTFDCTVPTQYARHGAAFTAGGKINIGSSKFLNDKKPLDPACECRVCGTYSRSYVSHLFRAKEITGMRLVSFHNLFFFHAMVGRIREEIRRGKL